MTYYSTYLKIVLLGVCSITGFILAVFSNTSTQHEELAEIENQTESIVNASLTNSLAGQPLRFVENQGQTGTDARYHVQGAGHTVLFNETNIEFRRIESATKRNELVLEFEGANPTPAIEGVDKLRGVVHFYTGSDSGSWRRDVPTYGAVIYRDLYPGIDMAYIGDESTLESEFYLSPGADHESIRLKYKNAKSITIRDDGALVLDTDLGKLVEKAPIAYQEINGIRVELEAQYVLLANETIGFELGTYDPDYAVVIDPELVFQVSYGASIGLTSAQGVAIDNDGDVIIAGGSNLNFPVTDTIDGSNDKSISGLLMKLDGSTGEVIYSALFGGAKIDEFRGLVLDQAGNMYLTGNTSSDDFPVMNSQQDTLAGSEDAFLVSLTADAQLTYSTYLGGSDHDYGEDVTLDGTGNVFVAGTTTSSDFPTTAGAFQPDLKGGDPDNPFSGDFFVAKYNASRSIEFATYLGGSGTEITVCGIAANAAGQLTIAGWADSIDFPVANAYQGSYGGGGSFEGDMTVSRLNRDGDGLVYSTYFGGAADDYCSGVELGPNDDVSVSGSTRSQDFPVIGGESSPEAGFTDGVLLMLDNAGQPIYSVRSNRPGDDEFVEVTVGGDSTASPVSVYADSIAILEKSVDGSLKSVFVFEAPGVRVFAAHAVGGFLALAGDRDPSPVASLGKQSASTLESWIAKYDLGQATKLGVKKRLVDPSKKIFVGDVVLWELSVTNVGPNRAFSVQWDDEGSEGLKALETPHGTIGNIEPGEEVTKIFKTRLTGGYTGSTSGFNEFWASADNAPKDETSANFQHEPTFMDLFFVALHEAGRTSSHPLLIDVFVDSIRVAETLEWNTITDLSQLQIRFVSPKVEVVPAGAPNNSNPIASASRDLVVESSETESRLSNRTQYILNQVSDDSISVLAKLDARLEASDPGSVEFFMANSTDAPFDVVLLANGVGKSTDELIADDLLPGSTSDYVAVDPGLHQIELRNADGSERLATFEFNWTDLAGSAVTVLAGRDSASINALAMTGDGTISDPTIVSFTESDLELPAAFRILDNYPNPFNPSTTIQYELAGRANVTIAVYDVAGHRIRRLVSQEVAAGRYEVVWNGRNEGGTPVASGTYIVRLETEEGFDSRRLMLVK